MIRGHALDHYLGILRKHWLLILTAGALVLGSGALYHSRQVPAYSAVTKLKIIRQKASRSGADVPFTFEEDQVFYNTQYNLLTTQLDWAGQALDRAAERILANLGGGAAEPDAAARAIETAAGLRGAAIVRALSGATAESDRVEIAETVARLGEELIELDEALSGTVTAGPECVAAAGRVRENLTELDEVFSGTVTAGPEFASAIGRVREDLTGLDELLAGIAAAEPQFAAAFGGLRQELTGLDGLLSRALMPGRGSEADVARVRAEVIEKQWGLAPDSFLAGVEARPIPNTYLAELSFTAADPGLAVAFANLYAELYRDVSTEERVETVEKQRRQIEKHRGALATQLKDEEKKLMDLRKVHPELSLGPSMNLPQQEADAIATRINSLEVEEILARSDLERIREALGNHGIRVRDDAEKPIRLEAGAGGDLPGTLARAADVLGLRVAEASPGVTQARGRIRALEEEIARLRRDMTEQAPEVKEARASLAEAKTELGEEVAGAITRALQAARDRGAAIADLRARLEERRKQARDLNDLYSNFVATSDRVAAGRREIESLDAEIQALLALEQSRNERAGAGPLTIRSIGIERRARLVDAKRIRPNTTMILLLTGLAALFLSLGSAFLVEFLDDTIKTKEDFVRLVGVPDIGFIPRISEKDFERKDTAVAEQPRSGISEAFRSVRTGILFSKKDEEIRSFLITSAGPGEGKTTVAVNLALVMAEAGRGRILLIDADLRKPRVHTALGVENTTGLTNCLVGNASLADAVRTTEIENLDILPAGPMPPNPAELLGGHRMTEILEEALATYGKVILDTPPLLAVTDTRLIAPRVEGVFLVISVGKTSWRLIARAKEALEAVGQETTGAILNNIRSRQGSYGYGYGFEGGYGDSPSAPSSGS